MMEAHARLSRKAAADAVLSRKQTNTTQVSPAIQDAALLSWKHAHLKKKKKGTLNLKGACTLKIL